MATATLDSNVIEAAVDHLGMRLQAARRNASPLAGYYDDPERFILECVKWGGGQGPTDYQKEVARRLIEKKRVALRCPHGAGKTAIAALLILWFALTREACGEGDWKIVMTASAWRQLSHYLAPEIHKWVRQLDWFKMGRAPFDGRTELLQQTLKLNRGEAFCAASDKPDLIEGAHADRLLYVFDEAKAIPPATWDAAEGALASGNCMAFAISTPGEPQGRFYDIHARKPGLDDWWVRHVTLEECVAAGRVSAEWAQQRKLQWGDRSAVYQNRVLGEFASSDEDGMIPLAWIEAANERWREREESGEWGEFTRVGVDVGGGVDLTVLALRYGDAIKELRPYNDADPMVVTGHVAAVLRGNGGEAVVDVIGIGAGVVGRLREEKWQVQAFNAGEGTDWKDQSGELQFVNKRSAAWWNLREMLDPANNHNIALPPDDLLIGDLTAPHWRPSSSGKIVVESKDDIRKRLGRSTDSG
ncbi:MAG: DEAD/DEAH box helicase family protein, partial [Pseudomonadota bacterium]